MTAKVSPEARAAKKRAWHVANRHRYKRTPAQMEARRAYGRAQYAANPEARREYFRKASRSEKTKATKRAYNAARRDLDRKRRGLPDPTRPCPVLCEICAQPPQGKQSMNLDHDHATGKFRGWLCSLCNRGLGFFHDRPDLLLQGAVYLERNK